MNAMNIKMWVMAGSFFIGWTAIGQTEEIKFPSNPLEGRSIFVQKGCIQCHSVFGERDSLGPDLTRIGEGRNFAKLVGLFWSHTPKMIDLMEEKGIAYPHFSEVEMEQLMSYIYFLSYFSKPGDYSLGKQIFESKECIKCHSLGGHGGQVAPALDAYAKCATPIYLIQAMWNRGPKMSAKMKELHVERPIFQQDELKHLIAYIRAAATDVSAETLFSLPGNPKVGKQVYENKGCATCHNPKNGSTRIGPDLSSPDRSGLSIDDIAERLWVYGSPMWEKMEELEMPVPVFEKKEMIDLIAYLHFLPYSSIRGDANRGQKLFVEKGCVMCHGANNQQKDGPRRSLVEASESFISLATEMWNHTTVMREMLAKKNLRWPQFFEDEMQDLLIYLRSLHKDEAK
ncbi:MAG: c-type cytochrome [Waddliaceae bacterium]